MATTTTLAATGPPPSDDNNFFSQNWWWLTIVGLALIAMIATIALLQPQRQGFGDRVAVGAGGRAAGRPRAAVKPAAPTVGARVRRTRVAQSISMRGAQPKPPKPSLLRRWRNRLRDTELADTFRARSEAKQVKARTSRKKPPRLKRRR